MEGKRKKKKKKKINLFFVFSIKGGKAGSIKGNGGRHSHYDAVRSRAHLADQLPSLFEVEGLVERLDAVVATVREKCSLFECTAYLRGECVPPDTYRLRKFSSENGSASLETLLTLDLPRAIMSEDGEPSDEREDEGGPCAFASDPPCSSVRSTGMAGRWICDYAPGQCLWPTAADRPSERPWLTAFGCLSRFKQLFPHCQSDRTLGAATKNAIVFSCSTKNERQIILVHLIVS